MTYTDMLEGQWEQLWEQMTKDGITLPCVEYRKVISQFSTLREYLMSCDVANVVRCYFPFILSPKEKVFLRTVWYGLGMTNIDRSPSQFTKLEVDHIMSVLKQVDRRLSHNTKRRRKAQRKP